MNQTDTLKILAILKCAYPSFYKGLTAKDANNTVALWTDMFAQDDPAQVAAAVKALIATDEKGFPPHIGAVKAKLRILTNPGEMSEAEAWNFVRKAIKRGLYNSNDEFGKLPKMIQRLVGSPSQLREWAMMDEDIVQSVVASNFQRSFRARQSSEREYQMLPPDVKSLVDGIAEKLAIGG